MPDKPRCPGCGHQLHDGSEKLTVKLPRSGVVASVVAPARRCAGCGAVRVEEEALWRAHLAVGCALADRGVQTGDALRHMRSALGLRAADLARLLGVTPETISHWETGRMPPARSAFVAVAAMVDDVRAGRTTTRDRLAILAEGRPYPRTLSVADPPARERGRPPRLR
jgi:DNA-binding XRE family transcriptional regulator